MKRPSFQLYPADWRKDPLLQSCSIGARGLWIECCCIAHECQPYGHLTVNGKPMTTAQIGRLVGLSTKEAAGFMAELVAAGVPGITADGTYFSRRMVKDEITRNARAAGGQSGAEHGIKGAEHGKKGGRPPVARGVSKPPLVSPVKPAPSSSLSTSSSPSVPEVAAKVAALVVAKTLPPQIPEWIPVIPWDAFVAMRRRIKKPVTEDVLKSLLSKLSKFREAGHDIGAILEESVLNQWQGVFPPKNQGNANGKAPANHSFGARLGRVVEGRAGSGFALGDDQQHGGNDRQRLEGGPAEAGAQLRLTHQPG